MEYIKSKVNGNILHIIARKSDISERKEIISPNNFLQCASMLLHNGKTFRPHKHIKKERYYKEQIAQESWIVIQGKVRCSLFDIDDSLLAEPVLEPGDASFTLEGGHTYTILQDNTLIYEYKTGPYEGQELDKEFIG
jgi:hypothetical protein